MATLTGPWYNHYEHFALEASKLIALYLCIPDEERRHLGDVQEKFIEHCTAMAIFDNEEIEGEARPRATTRRVLVECMKSLPKALNEFIERPAADLISELIDGWAEAQKDLLTLNVDPAKVVLGTALGEDMRGAREIVFHYIAILKAQLWGRRYFRNNGEYLANKFLKRITRKGPVSLETLRDQYGIESLGFVERPVLFSEAAIRDLHQHLAGPLPGHEVAPVNRGKYRQKGAYVDGGTTFPRPTDLPALMQHFVIDSNATHQRVWDQGLNPFVAAARISHDFVRIHPFSDFNGRTSRLLVTALLESFGIPYPISLRGDRKKRRRYGEALRKADRDQIEPYACLIARATHEMFERFDSILTRVHNRSLTSYAGNLYQGGNRSLSAQCPFVFLATEDELRYHHTPFSLGANSQSKVE